MFWRLLRHSHHYHRHHPPIVVLFVDGLGIFLHPNQEALMTTKVTVGHTINLEIVYQDQSGNPMLTPIVTDAAPAWTNTNPAAETLVAAADGLTAIATAIAAGADTIDLKLAVGGHAFSASLDVEVDAVAQVLTTIAIKATVV